MAEMQELMIDGPIPGQGLTAEYGNRPWQLPPQYNTVDQAMEFYVPRLLEPNFVEQLLDVIETGIPLSTIANAMQLGAVMEGKHSADVGILMIPIIVELMSYIAETAGTEYTTGREEDQDDTETRSSTIALAVKRAKEKIKSEQLPVPGMEGEEEEMPENLGGTVMGLMSRRQ